MEVFGEKLMNYSGSIVLALAILIAGIIMIKVLLKIAKKALEKSRLDASIHRFILSVIKYTLYVVLLVVILSALKVPTAPLVTVLGAIGAAVALGLQGSLSNVSAGILILLNKPFKKGDYIDTNGYSGTVEAIDITTTSIITLDNRTVILPNSSVLGSAIVNNTAQSKRRVELQFGISYKADIGRAKEVLYEVCRKNQYVLDDPAPFIGVTEHGASAVMLDLLAWVETKDIVAAKYDIKEQVKLALDEAGIEIPFTQIDVHLDK